MADTKIPENPTLGEKERYPLQNQVNKLGVGVHLEQRTHTGCVGVISRQSGPDCER